MGEFKTFSQYTFEAGFTRYLLDDLVGSIVVVSSSIGFCTDTDDETERGNSRETEVELD
jgi:hypothetical protein